MATRNGKALLTREDWARAALSVIAEAGVPAVTIDELAKRLGATRGSFYWHYHSREELIEAAVELWARESTTDRLPQLEAIADPGKRLRALLRSVYEAPADATELMLSTAGDDPLVAPVFAQVTRRRMEVLQRIFTELGIAPPEAADRAWLAYAFYVGHHQLRKNPQVAAQRPARLDRMAGMLTGGGGLVMDASGPAVTSGNLQAAQQLYAALRAQDPGAVLSALTRQFRGVVSDGMPAGLGGTYDGPETMLRECWARVFAVLDLRPVPAEYLPVSADRMIVLGRYEGTARSTGRPLSAAFAHILRFADGRVSELAQITDTARWHDALAR